MVCQSSRFDPRDLKELLMSITNKVKNDVLSIMNSFLNTPGRFKV